MINFFNEKITRPLPLKITPPSLTSFFIKQPASVKAFWFRSNMLIQEISEVAETGNRHLPPKLDLRWCTLVKKIKQTPWSLLICTQIQDYLIDSKFTKLAAAAFAAISPDGSPFDSYHRHKNGDFFASCPIRSTINKCQSMLFSSGIFPVAPSLYFDCFWVLSRSIRYPFFRRCNYFRAC